MTIKKTTMNNGYSKFLKSKIWNKVKQNYYGKKNIKNRHCFVCGSVKHLNIHHLKYKGDLIEKTFGLTDPVNLVILCSKCHLEAHKNPKEFKMKLNRIIYPNKKKVQSVGSKTL